MEQELLLLLGGVRLPQVIEIVEIDGFRFGLSGDGWYEVLGLPAEVPDQALVLRFEFAVAERLQEIPPTSVPWGSRTPTTLP